MERSWKQGSARSTEVACSVLGRGGCIGHRKTLSLCEHFLHMGQMNIRGLAPYTSHLITYQPSQVLGPT